MIIYEMVNCLCLMHLYVRLILHQTRISACMYFFLLFPIEKLCHHVKVAVGYKKVKWNSSKLVSCHSSWLPNLPWKYKVTCALTYNEHNKHNYLDFDLDIVVEFNIQFTLSTFAFCRSSD